MHKLNLSPKADKPLWKIKGDSPGSADHSHWPGGLTLRRES